MKRLVTQFWIGIIIICSVALLVGLVGVYSKWEGDPDSWMTVGQAFEFSFWLIISVATYKSLRK